jgi:site-specific recombinase XerD
VAEYLTGHIGSPNTYTAYRSDLADFSTFCQARHRDPLDATRADIAAYLHGLQQAGRSPATVARRLVVLRGFYDLAILDYGLSASPVARIRYRRPRSHRRLPALTVPELHAFLQVADAHSLRTSGLAWLLATTGLRISEACGALVDDVTQRGTEPWLDVICKGGLRRTVPLHDATWQRLEPLLLRPRGPIFATRSGAALDRRAASRTLVRIAAQAGIRDRFSPHVLRHTFVTLARATGCPLEDVQEAAGHADPATTRSYDRTLLTHAAHPAHRILLALNLGGPIGNEIGGGVGDAGDSCPT